MERRQFLGMLLGTGLYGKEQKNNIAGLLTLNPQPVLIEAATCGVDKRINLQVFPDIGFAVNLKSLSVCVLKSIT